MYRLLIPQIFKLMIYMLIGFGLRKSRVISSEQSKGLSILCLYAAVPCSILLGFQSDCSAEIIGNLKIAFAMILFLHLILWGVGFLMKKSGCSAVERISVVYPNCGNLVIPLVMALLGSEYVIYSSCYIAVQSFCLWTHGLSVLSGQKQINLKKILLNPSIIAFAAGVVLFFGQIELPDIAYEVIETLSGYTGPLAMVVAGILLAELDWRQLRSFRRLPIIVGLRLLLVPALIALILRLLLGSILASLDPGIVLVCYFSCITPTAISVVQMAQVFTDDATYASALNATGMALCIITMPLMVFLYEAL